MIVGLRTSVSIWWLAGATLGFSPHESFQLMLSEQVLEKRKREKANRREGEREREQVGNHRLKPNHGRGIPSFLLYSIC